MDYFKLLNLSKEPFSNSPDPEYFFMSRQHTVCLQKLELSLRLRRGLNVVIGDVGTGKTTLCRQIIRRFALKGNDDRIETHLILDPNFNSASEFLSTVVEMFIRVKPKNSENDRQLKEIIKKYLFRKGVYEQKTVVMIIDEGQTMPVFCLEILREFLNYETNEYKLLQIAVFAQKEFEKTLKEHANLDDRISLYHLLEPLSFRDTKSMIKFRLEQAGHGLKQHIFFTYPALWAIYLATGGYPRKIVTLCHRSLLAMIIQNRTRAGWFLVRSCVKRIFYNPLRKWPKIAAAVFSGLIFIWILGRPVSDRLKMLPSFIAAEPKKSNIQSISQSSAAEKRDNHLVNIDDHPVNIKESSAPVAGLEKPGVRYLPEPAEHKTDAEIIHRAADKISMYESRMPINLGSVALKQNETLWKLIEKVYGTINEQYLDLVIQANPGIDNPDHIKVNESISLPAIPAKVKPLPDGIRWVKAGEKENLDNAVEFLRLYPDNGPPVRLIPYWNKEKGLKIAIICREYFFDEATARLCLKKLPRPFALDGKIISIWNKDTVFFADPYTD